MNSHMLNIETGLTYCGRDVFKMAKVYGLHSHTASCAQCSKHRKSPNGLIMSVSFTFKAYITICVSYWHNGKPIIGYSDLNIYKGLTKQSSDHWRTDRQVWSDYARLGNNGHTALTIKSDEIVLQAPNGFLTIRRDAINQTSCATGGMSAFFTTEVSLADFDYAAKFISLALNSIEAKQVIAT